RQTFMAEARQPIAALVSLGCPKNLVDSERMLAEIALGGFAVSAEPDGADLAVVNTCAFIDLARAEADEVIAQMEQLKRAGRLGRLVVAGCMAQREGASLLARHPGVDAVAGLAERENLADLCRALLQTQAERQPIVRVGAVPSSAPDDLQRLRLTPRHYAYLRITEGCDNRCAYCAIPAIRGPLRSKPPDAVLAEAEELVADGAKELVLIGQDTTAYGRERDDGWTLALLLARLREESGAAWLRLMYTHPAAFTEEVIAELARGLPIVPYVDLPLQHASDPILASMGRRVTHAGVEQLLERLRRAVPGLALRTTFIVGYPGETQKDFESLLALVRKVRFDHVGVFLYSPEAGTRAAGLPDQVSAEVRRERWERLMRLAKRLAHEAARRMVGRQLAVRVDGPAEEAGHLAARHAGQAPEVDSVVLVRAKGTGGRAKPGDELTVRIVAAKGYDTVGEVVQASPRRSGATP
ncbi:MAG TPA: 30S ribosomal protein S12 methylthiotransferase RimO, partial [Phycisphaerae bacterium]|nr:30S ribosomal protein S12 methylthiotransferase RimO [Phycisphaerae bacterium]